MTEWKSISENARRAALAIVLLICAAGAGLAAETGKAPEELPRPAPPVTTEHRLIAGPKSIPYSAEIGCLPLGMDSGKKLADMCYTAYQSPGERRPVSFAFNGGPGASSIWLHFGALGPRRVVLTAEGGPTMPPFQSTDNGLSWIAFTDLVFVDPVGTGFSRAAPGVRAEQFYGVKGDIESVAEFIRHFLTVKKRWSSPRFLVGESYGTTRAAGVAEYLQGQGIELNGLVLISPVLDFITLRAEAGNDLPYVLQLPVYATACLYHGRCDGVSERDWPGRLAEIEQFAVVRYLPALAQGSQLSESAYRDTARALARYTGYPEQEILASGLRIDKSRFMRDLLGDGERRIGSMDVRVTGARGLDDPSFRQIIGEFVSAWQAYVSGELRYQTAVPYVHFSTDINRAWKWDTGEMGFPSTADALERAMLQNRYLRVLLASGRYDLTAPYFAVRYTLNHMRRGWGLASRCLHRVYESGHQVYTDPGALEALARDAREFYTGTLAQPPAETR